MFTNICLKLQQYRTQIFAVLTGAIGLVANGMEYGWPSPAIPMLSKPDSPIPDFLQHPAAVDLIQVLYMGGSACGMPLSFSLLQYLGRRKAILFSVSVGFICWIIIATASTVEQIYVARFFSGVSSNCMFVGLPMYSAEIVEPAARGFFGAFVYLMSMLGVVIAYAIIPNMPIYASAILGACICGIMLVLFYFQPESPYYLLTKIQYEEAEKSLRRLRFNQAEVNIEIQELITAVKRQESERGHLLDLVRIKSNRKATLIMLLLNVGQNMSGITVLIMNAQTLLQVANGSEEGGIKSLLSDEHSAVVFGATMLTAGILGAIMIDKYGRRVLLIGSSALSTCCLLLLSCYYYSAESFAAAGLSWLPLFTLIAYAFAFKCGLGVVPIVITGELFPTSVKAVGMLLADVWFTVLATLSLQIYLATTYLGLHVPFAIFTICAGLTTILVAIYVPETKGKSLEEIQMMLKNQVKDESK